MTIKTWRAEFMPKMPTKKLTKRQAVEHSLRKWEGLTKENLKKHGVFQSSFLSWIIVDEGVGELTIDALSCALCIKYWDYETSSDLHADECRTCPLFKTLGHPCDGTTRRPYESWVKRGNALPMIKALRKTLENLED